MLKEGEGGGGYQRVVLAHLYLSMLEGEGGGRYQRVVVAHSYLS